MYKFSMYFGDRTSGLAYRLAVGEGVWGWFVKEEERWIITQGRVAEEDWWGGTDSKEENKSFLLGPVSLTPSGNVK